MTKEEKHFLNPGIRYMLIVDNWYRGYLFIQRHATYLSSVAAPELEPEP